MAITIRVGEKANQKLVTLEMDIRKSLSGDLMIFDHGDMDIVLSTTQNKVIAFPKEIMSDYVYGAQNRLFTFLRKRGVVIPESIQAGSFYGALEATMEESKSETMSTGKMVLLNISNFIDEERPYFEATEAIISMSDDEFIDPDKEDSTELGEVPQAVKQGSIRKGFIRDPYALTYLYTM
jgi:hypothetical protein|tara:strand:+ start:834 stop:1373 length:540 start_codon:yes stop_codon:yes gene_type:complete